MLYEPITDNTPTMDVADVVALEQRIAAEGTPLHSLMARAGSALARYIIDHCEDSAATVVLAGSGNNGGDGWVAARELAKTGYPVALFSTKAPADIKAEPARSTISEILADIEAGDYQFTWFAGEGATEALPTFMERADVVLDALLGTGFSYDKVREPAASWIKTANDSDAAILAADIPSGVNAQTGAAAEPSIHAHSTVTMLAVKTGMLEEKARELEGDIYLASLETR